MMTTRLGTTIFVLAGSMLGGALISYWITGISIGWNPLSLLFGAASGFLGWFLSENFGDAVVILIRTVFPGLVVLSYLHSEPLRILAIAFLCGFNTGKLIGSVYKEFT